MENTSPSPYQELNTEQCEHLRNVLAERYWQTMDYLASITVDRARLDDEIASRA